MVYRERAERLIQTVAPECFSHSRLYLFLFLSPLLFARSPIFLPVENLPFRAVGGAGGGVRGGPKRRVPGCVKSKQIFSHMPTSFGGRCSSRAPKKQFFKKIQSHIMQTILQGNPVCVWWWGKRTGQLKGPLERNVIRGESSEAFVTEGALNLRPAFEI